MRACNQACHSAPDSSRALPLTRIAQANASAICPIGGSGDPRIAPNEPFDSVGRPTAQSASPLAGHSRADDAAKCTGA